jgi:hypothetical protein
VLEDLRNDQPCVVFDHLEVGDALLLGAVGDLPRVLLAPLGRDVAQLRMAADVFERETVGTIRRKRWNGADVIDDRDYR